MVIFPYEAGEAKEQLRGHGVAGELDDGIIWVVGEEEKEGSGKEVGLVLVMVMGMIVAVHGGMAGHSKALGVWVRWWMVGE